MNVCMIFIIPIKKKDSPSLHLVQRVWVESTDQVSSFYAARVAEHAAVLGVQTPLNLESVYKV